jgi:hypothetical protein
VIGAGLLVGTSVSSFIDLSTLRCKRLKRLLPFGTWFLVTPDHVFFFRNKKLRQPLHHRFTCVIYLFYLLYSINTEIISPTMITQA